ncbi:uncharacterized protein TNCV_2823801 [Trichonephila clavipes]|nr:uncharacterized protein TNCV_2823801 [Trichonephila clavipes]
MTATAGSDVVQSGRPIFDDFFQQFCLAMKRTSEKLTVWCALWAGGIIGPYFFKNDEGHNVTVNGDRYRAMITNFFIPELNNHDVQSLVYADKPQTLDHLEDNIRRVIADMRPEMLEKVIENWTSRLDYIRASRGSHMPEIIFKISIYHLFRVEFILEFDIWSRNDGTARISPLQWIVINESEGYLFSPLTGPWMSPISLFFKDSVSIDTGLNLNLLVAKSGISHKICKWHMELVTKSNNGICKKSPNLEVAARHYLIHGPGVADHWPNGYGRYLVAGVTLSCNASVTEESPCSGLNHIKSVIAQPFHRLDVVV